MRAGETQSVAEGLLGFAHPRMNCENKSDGKMMIEEKIPHTDRLFFTNTKDEMSVLSLRQKKIVRQFRGK